MAKMLGNFYFMTRRINVKLEENQHGVCLQYTIPSVHVMIIASTPRESHNNQNPICFRIVHSYEGYHGYKQISSTLVLKVPTV